MPQLVHMVSCSWWRGDGRSMWRHPSTNYNSPHGRVVVTQVVAVDLFSLKREVFGGSNHPFHIKCTSPTNKVTLMIEWHIKIMLKYLLHLISVLQVDGRESASKGINANRSLMHKGSRKKKVYKRLEQV